MTGPQDIEELLSLEKKPEQERRVVKIPTNLDEVGWPVCPYCGCNKSEVENTYPWQNGVRRRRRKCDYCKMPFHTVQNAEQCEAEDRLT